jgi:hypothetical protein
MSEAEMIKSWVVMKATVTRPTKNIWSASVTILGYDENGMGSTIERAYNDLVDNLVANEGYRFYIIEKLNK